MKVGILLLSQDNYYVDASGALPRRPRFDKELLKKLMTGQKTVAGPNTRKALPDSMRSLSKDVPWDSEYDLNLGIVPMLVNPPHLLIVVRSAEWLHSGKEFSLLPYSNIFKSDDLELWIYRK